MDNFSTFPSCLHVNCVIRTSFDLDSVHKDESCCYVNVLNPSKFYPGVNSTYNLDQWEYSLVNRA